MRKIEKQMCAAIHNNVNWSSGNTAVYFDPETGVSIVRLHGNKIAEISDNDMTILMVVISPLPQNLDSMHFALNFVLLAKEFFRRTSLGL